jgi:lipopolysaccharide biosynthesis regulator YciM
LLPPLPELTSQAMMLVALSSAAALVVGLAAGGWLAARRLRRQQERMGKLAERSAMMRGISYILANEPDMAIEELTKAARINSETVETYVALGNLFRSKGEFERAIRIRQTIILRPNLDPETKLRALFDMGLDYRKGGLIERAINCFRDVTQGDPGRVEAYVQLESLYEEIKDWEQAFRVQEKIDELRGSSSHHVLAHLCAESGKALAEKGDVAGARAKLKQAVGIDPDCLDAYLHLGDLNFRQGKVERAIDHWRRAAEIKPAFSFLAYRRLEEAAGSEPPMAEQFLRECCARGKDPFALMYLARHLSQRGERREATSALHQALEIEPGLLEARRLLGELLLSDGLVEEALAQYRELLAEISAPKRFECGRCGFQAEELTWRCPGCACWDTLGLRRAAPREVRV